MSEAYGEPEEDDVDFTQWAPIYGRWELENDVARYMGPGAPLGPDVPAPSFGILLAPELEFSGGSLAATIRFLESHEPRPRAGCSSASIRSTSRTTLPGSAATSRST